jgi:hypothetical protein
VLRAQDLFRREIHLPKKRWKHIITEHPEVKPYLNKIPEVLKVPLYVKQSKTDPTVWLYYRFFKSIFSGKYLLVVVKHTDKIFVITSYLTDKIKKGATLWQGK